MRKLAGTVLKIGFRDVAGRQAGSKIADRKTGRE